MLTAVADRRRQPALCHKVVDHRAQHRSHRHVLGVNATDRCVASDSPEDGRIKLIGCFTKGATSV